MDLRFALLGVGAAIAVAWIPLRVRYLRSRGKPYVLPDVPWFWYLGGMLLFGAGGALLLFVGLTRPLGIATGIWLLVAPLSILFGLIGLATWIASHFVKPS